MSALMMEFCKYVAVVLKLVFIASHTCPTLPAKRRHAKVLPLPATAAKHPVHRMNRQLVDGEIAEYVGNGPPAKRCARPLTGQSVLPKANRSHPGFFGAKSKYVALSVSLDRLSESTLQRPACSPCCAIVSAVNNDLVIPHVGILGKQCVPDEQAIRVENRLHSHPHKLDSKRHADVKENGRVFAERNTAVTPRMRRNERGGSLPCRLCLGRII